MEKRRSNHDPMNGGLGEICYVLRPLKAGDAGKRDAAETERETYLAVNEISQSMNTPFVVYT